MSSHSYHEAPKPSPVEVLRELEGVPPGYVWLGWAKVIMSTVPEHLNAALIPVLQTMPAYADYPGPGFVGHVWWNRRRTPPCWSCEVWVDHQLRAVVHAPSLVALRKVAVARYGKSG